MATLILIFLETSIKKGFHITFKESKEAVPLEVISITRE